MKTEQLKKRAEFVENLVLRGIRKGDSYDFLEAEEVLNDIGPISPSDDVINEVVTTLEGSEFHKEFYLIKVCAYLYSPRIRTVLEKKFVELQKTWKATDETRLYESYHTLINNLERRAAELSALRIIADPYLKTLDEFFLHGFKKRDLDRFPGLRELQQNLDNLRKEKSFNKKLLLEALSESREKIENKLAKLKGKDIGSGSLAGLSNNRLISLYYSFLEALIEQGSDLVQINKDMLEKVSQDFRAALGVGTKSFVLSVIARIGHEGFNEIAAEARFSINAALIEKIERQQSEKSKYFRQTNSFAEKQSYNLYEFASSIIACNPTLEAFQLLFNSYNVSGLLLGLKALEKSELPPATKLKYLKILLDLGASHDYVYTRACKMLSTLRTPEAHELFMNMVCTGYGWRKARMPESAVSIITDALFNAGSSSDIITFSTHFDNVLQTDDEKVEFNLPYEGILYDSVFDSLAARFEKNPFLGINEMAQYRLFKTLLQFAFHTPLDFATSGKLRSIALIRRLTQVSELRLENMISLLSQEILDFKATASMLPQSAQSVHRKILVEAAVARNHLTTTKNFPPEEEKILKTMIALMQHFTPGRQVMVIKQRQLDRSIHSLCEIGPTRIRKRRENIYVHARRTGHLPEAMLPVRIALAGSSILRAVEPLRQYRDQTGDEFIPKILDSMGFREALRPVESADSVPSEESTEALWKELEAQLTAPLSPYQASMRSAAISKVTAGAANSGKKKIIQSLMKALYSQAQPDEARLAFIKALPVGIVCTVEWNNLLPRENERVLLELRSSLEEEDLETLKAIVPDLLDMLD